MLDIIIPHYKEGNDLIKNLLDSINNQINVDFNLIDITIVNDITSTEIDLDLIKSYKNLNIKCINYQYDKGPGVARQYGIDNTKNDYLMFIDSDDTLGQNFFLYVVINCIMSEKPDFVYSNIIKESFINNELKYSLKRDKNTFPWLHGKIFKREILNKNNISFHKEIRFCEDSYFFICYISQVNQDKIIYLDINSYIWKYNPNSATRKEKKYDVTVTKFDDFFHSPIYAFEYLKEKNISYRNRFIIKSLAGIHIILYSNLFDFSELKDKKEKYGNELIQFINTNKDDFKNLSYDELNLYYNEEKDELAKKHDLKYVLGFENFYNLIKN